MSRPQTPKRHSSTAAADVEMKVIKRNGKMENVSFDKILRRLKKIGKNNNIKINYTTLAMSIIEKLYDKIHTTKIDEITAEECASRASQSPDYDLMALHVVVSNHAKNTLDSFSATMELLYNFHDNTGVHSPLVSQKFIETVRANAAELDAICDYSRDYLLSYFGFKTLEKSYLMHINRRIVERPQHMWMRVAVGLHDTNMEHVRATYEIMSLKKMTHATPTLFNAGTPRPQLSSCFLLAMDEDSIDGIFNIINECALISKWSGGIGVACSKIRAKGSIIRGTNGTSNGIVPMLRVFNSTCLYVDQCFTPDTLIYTTDGVKEIQHCVAGQTKIYNLCGDTETIENVLEHTYSGEILSISSPAFVEPMRVTPEHPICVFRGDDAAAARAADGGLQFEWVEAREICPQTDRIVYAIPSETTREMAAAASAALTDEDCFMYGLILEAGTISNQMEKVELILYKKYFATVDFVKTYLENRGVMYSVRDEPFCVKEWDRVAISWRRTAVAQIPFRYTDFYNEAGKRRAHSRWLQLPRENLADILHGIVAGYSYTTMDNYVLYETNSRELLECVRFLCLRLGILAGGYKHDAATVAPQDHTYIPSYFLKIPHTTELRAQFSCVGEPIEIRLKDDGVSPAPTPAEVLRAGDYMFAPISAVARDTYSGILYDLKMPTEHNYMIHGGVVHNGGGKRNGSFAMYLEPWHADVEDFLELRKNHGDENRRARDLFYALWVPDLFMKRIKENGDWTLMCPSECPRLCDVYGEEFEELYTKYENEGRGRKAVKARDLWFKILDAQMETGTPYITYKDAVNRKSNQKNIGTIKSSNLCSEITLYTDKHETAVCNLASIALPAYVIPAATAGAAPQFDFDELHRVAKIATYNLNRVIDVNYYPTEKARRSNMRHRPIGIGIQGLADVFIMMNWAFTSPEAKKLNRDIFETIYHAAVESSMEIATVEGAYETFDGSPASQGILQFDMWGYDPTNERYNWDELKEKVKIYGLRNSMLLAPMPTASTSQILGYNECFEPITSNIYSRRTLAGEFILANKYLVRDLIDLGVWDEELKNNIIQNEGSIQHLDFLPQHIRDKYKTVWEIKMRDVIDMAADRGVFICQSQSLNLFIESPNYNILTSMHMYAFDRGLKTGQYYLRRRAVHSVQKFTIVPEKAHIKDEDIIEDGVCEMCSA